MRVSNLISLLLVLLIALFGLAAFAIGFIQRGKSVDVLPAATLTIVVIAASIMSALVWHHVRRKKL